MCKAIFFSFFLLHLTLPCIVREVEAQGEHFVTFSFSLRKKKKKNDVLFRTLIGKWIGGCDETKGLGRGREGVRLMKSYPPPPPANHHPPPFYQATEKKKMALTEIGPTTSTCEEIAITITTELSAITSRMIRIPNDLVYYNTSIHLMERM